MSNANTNTPSSATGATQGATTRPCGPGVCRSNPGCADVYCEGHPVNQVQPHEHDPLAMRWFWITYAAGLLAALALITKADALVAWLLG